MDDLEIRRSARRLRLGVFAVIGVAFGFYFLAKLGLGIGALRVVSRSPAGVAPSGLISDASILLLGIALFRLTQMLAAIAGGEFFSSQVTRRFRGFAFWLLLVALTGFFAPLLGDFLSSDRGEPHPMIFRLHMRELVMVLVTVLLFLLSRLLDRARVLEDEMREIV